MATSAAENLLCDIYNDPYWAEDIALHEALHGYHLVGAEGAIEGFKDKVTAAYQNAIANNLWTDTYAGSSEGEYFVSIKTDMNV